MESRFRGALPLLTIIVPIIAVAFVATRLHDFPALGEAVETMRSGADEWWAIPLFVVLYALFTVFLLPLTPLSAAAALTWGWAAGGTVELVTCTFAALVPFALARRGLTGWIARRVPREHIPEAPFTLFLLRLVPLVPFVAMNYLAGTTRVRTRDYIATTFFGSIPSVFLFAWFIDTMAGAALGVVEQATIIAACAAVAGVALVVRFVAKRLARLS